MLQNLKSAFACSLIILLLQRAIAQSWVDYEVKQGNIPSYVYPITVGGGAQISGNLEWTGSENLDIYLYGSGSDFLSNGAALTSQASSDNPEVLTYTALSGGSYYLRPDISSTTPTGYYFTISINDNDIYTAEDTIVSATSGITLVQINLQGTCSLRISYSGPGATVYFYRPGSDVTDTGNAFASDPTSMDVTPDAAGNWYIAINHGITSATSLTPYTLTIQTDSGSPCTNFCASKLNSNGQLAPGTDDQCLCNDQFIWSASQTECVRDCANVLHADGLTAGSTVSCQCKQYSTWNSGSATCDCDSGYQSNQTENKCVNTCSMTFATGRVANQANTCTCETGYQWNTTQQACVNQCQMTFAAGRGDGDINICTCDTGYQWNTTEQNCVNQCGYTFSTGRIDGFQNTCACQNNYEWNTTEVDCVIVCDMTYATGRDDGVTNACTCQAGYQWNATQKKCVVICDMTYAAERVEGIQNVCFCEDGYEWNFTQITCVNECDMTYSTGRVDNQENTCACQSGYEWNTTQENCVNQCQMTFANGRIDGQQNKCSCLAGYYWNASEQNCVNQCEMRYSNGRIDNQQNTCECQNGYTWNTTEQACVNLCDTTYSVGRVDGQIDGCICEEGLEWIQYKLSCKKNEEPLSGGKTAVIIILVSATVISTIAAIKIIKSSWSKSKVDNQVDKKYMEEPKADRDLDKNKKQVDSDLGHDINYSHHHIVQIQSIVSNEER